MLFKADGSMLRKCNADSFLEIDEEIQFYVHDWRTNDWVFRLFHIMLEPLFSHQPLPHAIIFFVG